MSSADAPRILLVGEPPGAELEAALGEGYTCRRAAPDDALEAVRSTEPALALVDLDSIDPLADGWIETLLTELDLARTPVLVVAACAQAERCAAFLDRGAEDCLFRPLSEEELRARVTIGLASGRRRSEHERLLVERTAELHDSRQMLGSIIQTAEDGIVTINSAGTIEVFNRAAERIFGYREEEVLGTNVSSLMPEAIAREHDDYIRRYLETGEAKIIGIGREVVGRRKDGREFPLELRVGPYDDGHFTGFVRDVSERKRLEAEYLQAQKMEAIGRLAGGVAHDFNNLLAGIQSGLRIALTELPKDHPARSMLEEVREEATRGASITRRLLDFSRTGAPLPLPIDPGETLRGLERMIRRLLGEDIALHLHCEASSGQAVADPRSLEQALLNLVINARDAMPGGGRLELLCEEVAVDAARAEELRCAHGAGSYARLVVADDGCGMEPEILARAREAFYTTKDEGTGTGLGLSTVDTIVGEVGGAMQIESTLGEGTRVSLYLPLQERSEQAQPAASPEGSEPNDGAQTILVVEDEKLVRLGVEHMLRELGYRVLSAKDPDEGLRVLQEHAGAIDLLLTDVVLPGRSGPELAREAKRETPRLKTLFMSAFPQEELLARGTIDPQDFTLEKPFEPADLSAKVRAALG